MTAPQHFDAIVVGAGMSGLAHAWHARRSGRRVALLEASPRVGGVIRTETIDGFRLEWAATSVPSTATHLLELLGTLPEPPQLDPARAAAGYQYLANRGGLHQVPRTPQALLRSARVPLAAKVRALSEVARPRRRAELIAARPETAYTFVQRRFGTFVAERFLRPFTTGIYGAAPEHLGAADAFPRLVALEARRGSVIRALMAKKGATKREVLLPARGMEAIPRAIGNGLGNALHVETEVDALVPGTREEPAVVWTTDGTRRTADEVVLAIPASAQARLVEPYSIALSQSLACVRYVPMVVAHVGFAKDQGPSLPDAFGFLRGTAPIRILGATFNSRLSPHVAPEDHELLTVYIGGSQDPEVISADDDWLRKRVLRDLARVLGSPIRPSLFELTRWPHAIPLFSPGHRGRMAHIHQQLAAARIGLLGSHVTGVALNDCCRAPASPRPSVPVGQ